MEFMCPSVTYTLSPDQQGIHQVIISHHKSTTFDQFNSKSTTYYFYIVLKDAQGDLIGDPSVFINSHMFGREISIHYPKDHTTPAHPLPNKDVIEPVFKRYVDDYLPTVQELEVTYHFPQTVDQIYDQIIQEIHQLKMDSDFGKLYSCLPIVKNVEAWGRTKRDELAERFKPYGIHVDYLRDETYIRIIERPQEGVKDTLLGRRTTLYMDEWTKAHETYVRVQRTVTDIIIKLEEMIDDKVDNLIQNDAGSFGKVRHSLLSVYPVEDQPEVEAQLNDQLGPFGLEVGGEQNSLYIHVTGRPRDDLKDYKIGPVITKYMDVWEPAEAAMLLAQTKLKE